MPCISSCCRRRVQSRPTKNSERSKTPGLSASNSGEQRRPTSPRTHYEPARHVRLRKFDPRLQSYRDTRKPATPNQDRMASVSEKRAASLYRNERSRERAALVADIAILCMSARTTLQGDPALASFSLPGSNSVTTAPRAALHAPAKPRSPSEGVVIGQEQTHAEKGSRWALGLYSRCEGIHNLPREWPVPDSVPDTLAHRGLPDSTREAAGPGSPSLLESILLAKAWAAQCRVRGARALRALPSLSIPESSAIRAPALWHFPHPASLRTLVAHCRRWVGRPSAGRAGEIRTPDLLNPIQARYQAALRPDGGRISPPGSICRPSVGCTRAQRSASNFRVSSSPCTSRSADRTCPTS